MMKRMWLSLPSIRMLDMDGIARGISYSSGSCCSAYGRRQTLGKSCRGDIYKMLWSEIWMCSIWGLLTLDLPCFRKLSFCGTNSKTFSATVGCR